MNETQAVFLNLRFKYKSIRSSQYDDVKSKVIAKLKQSYVQPSSTSEVPVQLQKKREKLNDLWDEFDSDVDDLRTRNNPSAA